MAYEILSPARLADLARAKGCTVVTGTDCELLLDLDIPKDQAVRRILETSEFAGGLFGFDSNPAQWKIWESSGGNTHVVISLGTRIPLVMRVALQLALGSDPDHELLSLRTIHEHGDCANVLFKPEAR